RRRRRAGSGDRAPRGSSEEPSQHEAREVAARERRAAGEDVVVGGRDAPQDGEPAAREEAHLAREAAGHQLGERKAAREEVARAGDLEGEEAAEVVVGRASCQRGAALGEAIQILLRDVEPAGVGSLVGQVVGAAREGVDRGQVVAEPPREQPRADGEVLVVPARDARAAGVGRRQPGGVDALGGGRGEAEAHAASAPGRAYSRRWFLTPVKTNSPAKSAGGSPPASPPRTSRS